jgi:serine/threonine protein kinase/tetratricopeptide (TPR) repeat protein
MPRLFSCDKGHAWPEPGLNEPAAGLAIEGCPICGGKLEPTSAVAAAPADLLPPPPTRSAPTLTPSRRSPSWTPNVSFPVPDGYEILRELGRGGMGVVYLARQKNLNRLVALKMILAGAHASVEELLRFRTEAETAAQLQHPNIVQIYEVGQQAGQPYCALEYVNGGSLAQRLAGTPIAPREAARLVATLARAVHYAHERGIIHRDLKPANILLSSVVPGPLSFANDKGQGTDDKGPVPKIADFGLAKHLGRDTGNSGAAVTHTGAILGTPGYMAPEQALGQRQMITTATDVYALGAVLYELLSGRPPFQAATPLETLQQVLAEDPVAPSRRQRATAGDLETICLKCLRKGPHERYGSAAALADDLERFVNGESIKARRATTRERFIRWCRRSPKVAALLGLLTLAILIGFAGVTLQWRRAERLRDETEANYRLARRVVADYFEMLGRDPLLDHPGALPLRQDLLQAALTHFQDLRQRSDDPELQINLARACYCLGRLREYLHQEEESLAPFDQAIAIQEQLVRENPDSVELQRDLARSYDGLGRARRKLNEFDLAHEAYRHALAIRERLYQADPQNPELIHDLAVSQDVLGFLFQGSGKDPAQGVTLLQQSRKRLERLVVEHPDNLVYQTSLSSALNDLGLALANEKLKRYEEAEQVFRAAIERQTPVFDQARHAARYRQLIGFHYFNLGRYALLPLEKPAEAADAARQALKLDPENPQIQWYSARVLAVASAQLAGKDEADHALARRCADDAMQALAEAVRGGYGLSHADLAALYSRPDYAGLVRKAAEAGLVADHLRNLIKKK